MAPKRKGISESKTVSKVTSAKHARTAVSAAEVPHEATASGAAGGAAAGAPAVSQETLDDYIKQGKTAAFQSAFEWEYPDPRGRGEHATRYLAKAAISKKGAKIINYLIKCGADVNHQDNDGLTALWLAALYNIAANVRALLAGGADANLEGQYNGQPLYWVVHNDAGEEVIELLLAAGARIDSVVHLAAQNSTPNALHALVKYGGTAVMELLNAKDSNGNTPLHYAAESASTACALYLLHLGVDKDITNEAGKTPNRLACESDKTAAEATVKAISKFNGQTSPESAEAFYTAWHEMVAKANAEEDRADHSACALAVEETLPHLGADVDVAGAAAGHADHHG